MKKTIYYAHLPADLLVLQRKFEHQFKEIPIYTVNFNVAEAAKKLGIKKIILINTKDLLPLDQRFAAHNEADRYARLIDSEIGYLNSKCLSLDFIGLGWLYYNLYCLIYSGIRVKALARQLLSKMSGMRVIIHSPINQPYFYMDSWLNKKIIANELKKQNDIVQINSSGIVKEFNPKFDYQLDKYNFKNLGHFPTTYYEQKKIQEAIDNTKDIIILPSQYWNIEYKGLTAVLNVASHDPIESDEIIKKKYMESLSDLLNYFEIENSPSDEMIEYFFNHSRSQQEIFKQLEAANKNTKIQSIKTADHDTCILGPLTSFANKFSIPLIVYPHSTTPVGPLYDTNDTIRVGLLRPTNSYTSLSSKIKFPIGIPPAKAKKIECNNVIILFNEFEDMSGIPTEDYRTLFSEFNSFLQNLASKNINVKVRFKPHHPYKTLFKNSFENADGPITQWTEWASVAIGIGQPTTALSKFDNGGCSTYHLQSIMPTELELASLPTTCSIIYHENWQLIFSEIAEILQKLKGK